MQIIAPQTYTDIHRQLATGKYFYAVDDFNKIMRTLCSLLQPQFATTVPLTSYCPVPYPLPPPQPIKSVFRDLSSHTLAFSSYELCAAFPPFFPRLPTGICTPFRKYCFPPKPLRNRFPTFCQVDIIQIVLTRKTSLKLVVLQHYPYKIQILLKFISSVNLII